MKLLVIAGLVASLGVSFARASIIVSLAGQPAPIESGPYQGDFLFNYTATLSGDERLDPAATAGATCPGTGGTLMQCSPSGTFFTIYDFAGLTAVDSVPGAWVPLVQDSGLTPSNLCSVCMDDPSIPNVTFFYEGPVDSGNGSDLPFTGFELISTYFGLNQAGIFSSQSTINVGPASGLTDQLYGPVTVPDPPEASVQDTIEPSTLILMGAGFIGLVMLRTRHSLDRCKPRSP